MLVTHRDISAATEYKEHIKLNHEIRFTYLQDFQLYNWKVVQVFALTEINSIQFIRIRDIAEWTQWGWFYRRKLNDYILCRSENAVLRCSWSFQRQ